MNKLEWLNWATEQGLIECEVNKDCTHWYVKSLKSPLVADEVDGKIEFYPTFMLVVLDWIDERGWFVTLQDVAIFDDKTTQPKREYEANIRDLSPYTNAWIGLSSHCDSRLEALLEAFKEAVAE